jgi:hypothetical protein
MKAFKWRLSRSIKLKVTWLLWEVQGPHEAAEGEDHVKHRGDGRGVRASYVPGLNETANFELPIPLKTTLAVC